MAITITIQNTPIEFPESSESPNWAPALVSFAQAVEKALATTVGAFDISPQIQNIDAPNPATNEDITNLNFPLTDVIKAEIMYGVYRQTDSTQVSEGGTLEITYNADNPVGEKWVISQTKQNEAFIEFSITDIGQLQYSTTALAGINHTGFISFRASSVLNT